MEIALRISLFLGLLSMFVPIASFPQENFQALLFKTRSPDQETSPAPHLR